MGSFTISLDFELYWGMLDIVSLEDYKENLLGVHIAIPKILELFREYQIHATWGIVGFIKYNNFDEIEIPKILPNYLNPKLSPYNYIQKMRGTKDKNILKMHFAPELIQKISNTPYQEIASHTYSHYYINEPIIDTKAFKSDIQKAIETFAKDGYKLDSLIVPRNHTDKESLKILKDTPIKRYRANPSHWAYRDGDSKKSILLRVYRLVDTYINLSGNHLTLPIQDDIIQIKSSLFLRPYSNRLRYLEPMKIKRIKDAMSMTAKEDKNFHLWWHPHNFGKDINSNLKNLQQILEHFLYLKKSYNLNSLTMIELANQATPQKGVTN